MQFFANFLNCTGRENNYGFWYFKLWFKEFRYNEKLSKDENINKILNFFATQKPINFLDYLKERSLKNIKEEPCLIENSEKKEVKRRNKSKDDKFDYPKAYFDLGITFYRDEEYKKYISLIHIFNFYKYGSYLMDCKEKKAYSIKFKEEDTKNKLDIFLASIIILFTVNLLKNYLT